jgi:hypothetical protein
MAINARLAPILIAIIPFGFEKTFSSSRRFR